MSDSFTNQRPRKATERDLQSLWGHRDPGEGFRCYLCGHKFQVGDIWRWVYDNGPDSVGRMGNFLVCRACDGPYVMERWAKHCEEARTRFWWLS